MTLLETLAPVSYTHLDVYKRQSQNMGARKYQNLNRVVLNCLLCAIVTGVVLGGGAVLAGTQLLHFYSSDAAVVAAVYERLRVICGTYLLCGIMDTLASSLRGLGYSVLPMVVSLVGSCLLRLVWIATIFQLNRTPVSYTHLHSLPPAARSGAVPASVR